MKRHYRPKNNRVQFSDSLLGEYPALTLSAARNDVADKRLLRDRGCDPLAERRERAHAQAKAETQAKQEAVVAEAETKDRAFTVRKLAYAFLDEISSTKSDHTWKQYRGALNRRVLPFIGDMAASEVTAEHITPLLRSIREEGKNSMTNRVQATISAMFGYGLDHHPQYIKSHPYIGRRRVGGKERSRLDHEEPLTTEQVGRILVKIQESILPERYILELLARCGTRNAETRKAKIEHINLAGNTWRIPGEDTKNGLPHTVHLSHQSVALLGASIGNRKRGYVFANKHAHGGHMRNERVNDAMRAIRGDGDVHLFRHALSTWMEDNGFNRDIRNRVLNHKKTGLDARYSKARLTETATRAWQQWSDAVDPRITAPQEASSDE